MMLSVEQIRDRLMDHSLRRVAGRIGVHENTLYRLVRGQTKPEYRTLKKLSDYLEGK